MFHLKFILLLVAALSGGASALDSQGCRPDSTKCYGHQLKRPIGGSCGCPNCDEIEVGLTRCSGACYLEACRCCSGRWHDGRGKPWIDPAPRGDGPLALVTPGDEGRGGKDASAKRARGKSGNC